MNSTIAQIRRTLLETISPRVIPRHHLPAFVGIIRELARGAPVSIARVADLAGTSERDAAELTRRLQELGMLEADDDGSAVGMVISLRPTPHQMIVQGTTLYTWCAVDTLFIPAILQQDALVESICPSMGTRIRLLVTSDGVQDIEPSDACVSLVAPGVTSGISPSCCGVAGLTGTEGAFCGNVHFFCSSQAARPWLDQHSLGAVVSVEEAYELAHAVWIEPLLGS